MLPNMSELFRRSALEGIAPTNFFNFTREGRLMLKRSISWGVLFALTASTALAQTATPTIETLQASAKALAGTDWPGTYLRLCIPTGSAADRVVPTINPDRLPHH